MKVAQFKGRFMGLTVLPLEVANQSNPQQTEIVEFLIDSGTVYSVVPRPIIERLGIAPVAEHTFRLASGQTIQRQTAGALAADEAREREALEWSEEGLS